MSDEEKAPGDSGGRPRRSRRRWLVGLLQRLAVVSVIAFFIQQSGPSAHRSTTPPPPSASSPASTDGEQPVPSSPAARVPPPTVTSVEAPLLGVTAGWELFARGDDAVVRVQLAAGRVTRTPVPRLRSTGPVSFLVGPRTAIIAPIDNVPRYEVPDGAAARPASASTEGPIFPGPDTTHVWLPNNDESALLLSGLESGVPAQPVIRVPQGSSVLSTVPDGAGYVLFTSADGTYDARPDGLHRITTGAVLAVGPTGWLTRDCAAPARCAATYVERASGARRVVQTGERTSSAYGVISPDGHTAALFDRKVTPPR